jgi:hypothetical protein
MHRMIVALVLFAVSPALAQEAGPLDWLSGAWCTKGDAQGQSCERWSAMTGGTMLGTSQTVKDSKTSDFEFLRITLDGGKAVYHAQPGGIPPVSFREVKREGQSVTFENAAHDYPQRIRYWREGEVLKAEISLMDGKRAMGWSFRKAK